MRNTTDLANFALMALGVGQIQSLTDGGNSAQLCSNWYTHAMRTTLSQGEYQSTIRRVELTSVGDPIDDWTYRYTIPSNCLKIIAVLDSRTSIDDAYEWEVEGNYLNCDVPGAFLKYVVLPEDISALDDLVAEAIGYKLALLVGPGLGMDQENAALREVERRFQMADGAARSVNSANRSRTTKATLWGQAGRPV